MTPQVPTPRRRRWQARPAAPRPDRATGGSGGDPPGKAPRAIAKQAQRPTKIRATPGGYGGKPPGVAFIGVPTGARNAGRCSDGGPEHHVHGTPKPPLVRQDFITGFSASGVFS